MRIAWGSVDLPTTELNNVVGGLDTDKRDWCGDCSSSVEQMLAVDLPWTCPFCAIALGVMAVDRKEFI